jgi:hypothetical protein
VSCDRGQKCAAVLFVLEFNIFILKALYATNGNIIIQKYLKFQRISVCKCLSQDGFHLCVAFEVEILTCLWLLFDLYVASE